MTRVVRVAAVQMGPVDPSESRAAVVRRLTDQLRDGAARGAELVVFPEAALTPFFPHWSVGSDEELDGYFEASMPNPTVQSLFDAAAELGVGFYLGFAELCRNADGSTSRFNSAILVERNGQQVGHYRKIHLPGYKDAQPDHPFQNLEKRYFEVGDLGFGVWPAFGGRVGMCICNDRRWSETYRVMGLQGVELVLVGYNTPIHNPAFPDSDRLAEFQSQLSLQAGAYQNACWVVGVAKAGVEAGVHQIGGTCVIAPTGEVVAKALTEGDEIVMAWCDLDLAAAYKTYVFDLAANRRPEHYALITARGGQDPDAQLRQGGVQ
jgi:N-carbamoyl-D-amino-acid hydrolase